MSAGVLTSTASNEAAGCSDGSCYTHHNSSFTVQKVDKAVLKLFVAAKPSARYSLRLCFAAYSSSVIAKMPLSQMLCSSATMSVAPEFPFEQLVISPRFNQACT